MRLADFDFELPDDRIALRPAAPRDAARLLVVAAERRARATAASRDLPDLLRARRRAGLQRHPGDPRAPARACATRDGSAVAVEATLHRRALALALDRLHASRASGWRSATAIALRRARTTAPACSARSTPTVAAKGEGGEVTLAFDLAGPDLDVAIADARRDAAAALHRRPPRPRTSATAPTTRPSTPARTARWPRRPPACTSRPSCWTRCEARGVGAALRHPARRRRHLPAGEDRGRRRAPHARRVRARSPPRPPRR